MQTLQNSYTHAQLNAARAAQNHNGGHQNLFYCCWRLNRDMSKHTKSAPVMPKMVQNRSALHDVLARGTSNRDITVHFLANFGCNPCV